MSEPSQDTNHDTQTISTPVGISNTSGSLSDTNNSKSLTKELPYSPFSVWMRATIVIITALTALVSPLSAQMYLPSLNIIRDELYTTQSGITWTVTSFVIGMALFPLIWSNLADSIGRKPVYALSMLVFTCGSIGCSLSHSLTTLIISRVVQAAGSSAVQSSGAGTISDIYPREQRGTALGLYYLGPLIGPSLGPLIGGYIAQNAGWRWVFWVLSIWGGLMLLLALFALPETHRRIVFKKYTIQQVDIPPQLHFKNNNPLEDVLTVRYPVVALVMFHFAMLFGAYFTNAIAQSLAYDDIYHLSQSTSGVCYLSVGVGAAIGSIFGGRTADLLLRKHRPELKAQEDGTADEFSVEIPAEKRLGAMWLGSGLFVCGLLVCGWLLEHKLSLAGVLVTQFIIGVGMSFTFQSLASYLIDVFPTRSARITGVQNFWRSLWGAILVQLSPTMLQNISWGWSYTIMFFLALASLLLMQFVVYRGESLRQRYGPSADLR